jgi:AcrR family transcriptional regulator
MDITQQIASPRSNRGPAAAEENRRALLRAARLLFARRGFRVPLSAIAKEAGVGQGVLYRHFPCRMDLAMAVFDENLTRLERTASAASGAGRPAAFEAVWRELLDLILSDVAFVETAVESERDGRAVRAADRLQTTIVPLLAAAQRDGRVGPRLTAADLSRALRAAYGLVVTAAGGPSARADVEALMRLLGLPGPSPRAGIQAP